MLARWYESLATAVDIIPFANLSKAQPTLEERAFIASTSAKYPAIGLSLYEKIKQARKLVMAVLQYNSTPWLKES